MVEGNIEKLEYLTQFDILFKTRLSGVDKQEYTMLSGKFQI